ncbi:Bug family tripartite tricarboxylate transporter substrate binding protein [Polaromonas eurypsychrophila]|uniref:MFS transporter n=1 Tax=Polaromonas eurypsychrophila TaxID=1614635 RepID=A0A916SLM9_9BURK|nr:tripartite tricarboxylate transporter substrate binding protein [Polaromonas eurypsychrophila]GGB03473.1 MFS transporter [Polaromonas eurypsychrophila]
MKRYLLSVFVGLGAVFIGVGANAQTYPVKPVRLVVPFPAGGATDILARTISLKASEKLGQQIVIDNRPGAGGTIGSDHVAKSAPDGYTLLIATGSTHSIGPIINPKIPYNVERDFVPVVYVAQTSSVLVVPASLPVKNLAEFIALAKSKPGQLNFGSSGNGTNSHLSGELFKAQAGVFITHIPYRGTGLVFNDMMSGQVHMLMDNYVTSQSNIKEGKLRVLGVTTPQRVPFLPDVPTLAEQGLKGFDVSNWFGIYAPKGAGADIVSRVNAAFNQALQDPEMQKRLATLGATPAGGTPEQMGKMVATDTARWSKLIRDRKIVVE